MAELETWAVVLFTGVLTLVEVHRWWSARLERQLERVQRKIELAFKVNRLTPGILDSYDKEQALRVAEVFTEVVAVLDFPGDQVIENDVRQVLGKLMARLQPPEPVDSSRPFERVQERIRWGLMGWVEESERLRLTWRERVASRVRGWLRRRSRDRYI